MVNNIKKVNPHHHPILLFDEPLTSKICITSVFVFKSKHFPFIAIIKVEHCSIKQHAAQSPKIFQFPFTSQVMQYLSCWIEEKFS
jgi:hypothetical protein